MLRGRMMIQSAEIKQSKKEGKGNYGIITLIAMGVAPFGMFTNEQMANSVVTGAEYDIEFRLKGKELDGILSIKKVK